MMVSGHDCMYTYAPRKRSEVLTKQQQQYQTLKVHILASWDCCSTVNSQSTVSVEACND